MPNYKNKLKSPAYIEAKVVGKNGRLIGEFRLKPSTVLWRPSQESKYFAVPLSQFHEWITSESTKAKRLDR